MTNLIYKNMQDLFRHFNLQIKDYKDFCKSEVWNEVLDKSFNQLDANKLNNFFSNNLSNGIANSRFYDQNTIKLKFFELCKKYKENGPFKIFDGFKLSNIVRQKLLENEDCLIN